MVFGHTEVKTQHYVHVLKMQASGDIGSKLCFSVHFTIISRLPFTHTALVLLVLLAFSTVS